MAIDWDGKIEISNDFVILAIFFLGICFLIVSVLVVKNIFSIGCDYQDYCEDKGYSSYSFRNEPHCYEVVGGELFTYYFSMDDVDNYCDNNGRN